MSGSASADATVIIQHKWISSSCLSEAHNIQCSESAVVVQHSWGVVVADMRRWWLGDARRHHNAPGRWATRAVPKLSTIRMEGRQSDLTDPGWRETR